MVDSLNHKTVTMEGVFFISREGNASFEEKLDAIENYLNGIKTVGQISTTLQVSKTTVQRWIHRYQDRGASGLQSPSENAHYPSEIKIQAVTDYLAGKISKVEICRKYQISSPSVFQKWLKGYNGHKTTKSHNSRRDKNMAKGRKTTYEERITIVSFCITNNDNYQLTSEKYQVSYHQVYTWIKKYKEGGPEALADGRGKRKDPKEMTETEKLAAQIKLLEAENTRLQMENGFLKKLKEVQRRRAGKINI
jgi:transposase